MKFLMVLLMSLLLVGCSDHGHVMYEYRSGNKHASDLLLHGFNVKNSSHISTFLINRALHGDEEAKQIIYSQIESLKGLPNDYPHVVSTPVYIRH